MAPIKRVDMRTSNLGRRTEVRYVLEDAVEGSGPGWWCLAATATEDPGYLLHVQRGFSLFDPAPRRRDRPAKAATPLQRAREALRRSPLMGRYFWSIYPENREPMSADDEGDLEVGTEGMPSILSGSEPSYQAALEAALEAANSGAVAAARRRKKLAGVEW